jgi:uncharacterized Zn finger protein (UPF0148 family)
MSIESDGLPSSDDLDRVAEEQAVVDATSDTTVNLVNDSSLHSAPLLCSCGTPRKSGQAFCPHCGQDFSDSFETKSEPIIDEDGSTHSGRRIRLIGEGWPNSLVMIKDLSDEELVTQIKGLQDLLKRAIQTADFAQISIAAREFEYEYRKHSRYVAAIRRREKIEQGSIRLNAKSHKPSGVPKVPADIAALMSLGITYEQALVMKAALQGKKS